MTRLFIFSFMFLFGSVAFSQQPALRIVVIEGEDAVNVVQQKTAVRPVVEVRDRNNVPVSGAIVTFSIQGGQAATFGGAPTLTVITNAAGQAAATGFTPSVAGAVQINVQAALQGQVATATIAQTNVMTAAEAVTAGAATGGTSGSSAGSGGGAGGAGGGGMSTTTIVTVGAVAAGGTIAAVEIAKNVDADEIFTGAITGQYVRTTLFRSTGITCTTVRSVNGSVHFEIDDPRGDRVEGHYETTGTDTVVSHLCPGTPPPDMPLQFGGTFNGTDSAIHGRETSDSPRTNPDGTVVQGTFTTTFDGARSGENTITGTIAFEGHSVFTPTSGQVFEHSSAGSFPVTLTKTK